MKNFILFILITILFSSCKTLVPYTESLRQKNGLSTEDLRNVQFYLSSDVNLIREANGNTNKIVSGKIKTLNNKEIEEVLIPSMTKGVFIDTTKTGKLKMSFSDDEHTLNFGPNGKTSRYVILAESWSGTQGTVHYGSDLFQTKGLSYDACLLVNVKQLLKIHRKFKVEKGRKL